ncbi:MAG: sensor histidine kinase [Lachnospiraceae bacterium]|nr:sensor histidine kinase [Lachnospiraceae bacterium]
MIISELCKKYTSLTEADIDIVSDASVLLQPLADLEEADVFIDCPMEDGDAIVVAEAKPTKVPSSYKKQVVGLLAKKENEPAVARSLRLGIGTRQMKATTQENRNTVQTVEPIRNGDKIIGVLIVEKREERKLQIQERLHLSKHSYSAIAESLSRMRPEDNWLAECIDEALLIVNKEGIITFRNGLAKVLFRELGYVEDVLGQYYVNVRFTKDEYDSDESDDYSYEETQLGRHVLAVRTVRQSNPHPVIAVIIRDITREKEQEKELVLKSVVVKEMHHRVKNNLQTIASLLRLQSRRTKSSEAAEVLEESLSRILSIASTHQILAKEGVDKVTIGDVIRDIRNNAVRAYSNPQIKFTIEVEGGDFKIGSDTATSIALITNELLHNALKYAFQDREEGRIVIKIEHGDLYSAITVEDNGQGFNGIDEKQEQLGLSIIKTLVKDKLQGNLEIVSDEGGTRARFDFKTYENTLSLEDTSF